MRTFKVERILGASLTPEVFEAETGAPFARELLRAWKLWPHDGNLGHGGSLSYSKHAGEIAPHN